MSKKDFIALADAIRGMAIDEAMLNTLCQFCKSRNPRFNEERFRGYLAGTCGPCGGSVKRKSA